MQFVLKHAVTGSWGTAASFIRGMATPRTWGRGSEEGCQSLRLRLGGRDEHVGSAAAAAAAAVMCIHQHTTTVTHIRHACTVHTRRMIFTTPTPSICPAVCSALWQRFSWPEESTAVQWSIYVQSAACTSVLFLPRKTSCMFRFVVRVVLFVCTVDRPSEPSKKKSSIG